MQQIFYAIHDINDEYPTKLGPEPIEMINYWRFSRRIGEESYIRNKKKNKFDYRKQWMRSEVKVFEKFGPWFCFALFWMSNSIGTLLPMQIIEPCFYFIRFIKFGIIFQRRLAVQLDWKLKSQMISMCSKTDCELERTELTELDEWSKEYSPRVNFN